MFWKYTGQNNLFKKVQLISKQYYLICSINLFSVLSSNVYLYCQRGNHYFDYEEEEIWVIWLRKSNSLAKIRRNLNDCKIVIRVKRSDSSETCRSRAGVRFKWMCLDFITTRTHYEFSPFPFSMLTCWDFRSKSNHSHRSKNPGFYGSAHILHFEWLHIKLIFACASDDRRMKLRFLFTSFNILNV
jgi:hypothetical protein